MCPSIPIGDNIIITVEVEVLELVRFSGVVPLTLSKVCVGGEIGITPFG